MCCTLPHCDGGITEDHLFPAHIFVVKRLLFYGRVIVEQVLGRTVATKTESERIAAAQNGDVNSFGKLYCRHYVAVVGVAYCALADRHLAEDAAHEAFVVASRENWLVCEIQTVWHCADLICQD